MDQRPDPDQLLKRIQAEESTRGQLKLFFGANAGVGKTYAMLEAAQQRRKEGADVAVGIVETHGRTETAALLQNLEVLPRRKVEYKGVILEEFDLDAALARKPKFLLVDELAHTNAPGSRHAKRWQDVQELLDAGINVYTTLNVQHWESLNDVVTQVTGIVVRETVPDTFLEQTHDIELVDLSPEDLLKRLKDGRVYLGPAAEQASQNFFKPGNLIALRELALRHAAERVDLQVQAFKADQAITNVWPVAERLLVGVTESAMSPRLVRAAHRLASRLRCEWIVLHVETPESKRLPPKERGRLLETFRLAEELGAETVTLTGGDVPRTLIQYARSRNVSKIIVGKPRRPQWRERVFGSVVNRIAHDCGEIDLYVISGLGGQFVTRRYSGESAPTPWKSWAWAFGAAVLCTAIAWPLFHRLERVNLVLVYLLGVMAVAYRLGRGPAAATAAASALFFAYFYVPPYFSLAFKRPQDVITCVAILVVGLLIAAATGRLRLQSEASFEREASTLALYRLSRELSETPDPYKLTLKAWQHLEEFYRTPVLLLKSDGHGHLIPAAGNPMAFEFDDKESAVAQWAFDRGQEAGAGTNTLAAARGLYLPLRGLQGTVGVLGIRPGNAFSPQDPDQVHLLQTFASEIGAALASTELSEAAGRAEAQVEAESLRNLILSSFSIDINQPLEEITSTTRRLLGGTSLPDPLKQGLQEIQNKTIHLGSIARELPRLIEARTKQHLGGALAGPGPERAPQEQAAPAAAPAPAKIRLGDILSPGSIFVSKGRKTKEQVLEDMIRILRVQNPEEALALVMDREKAGSTIIGARLAIPHARIPGLTNIKAALAVVPNGISAWAKDDKPIQLVMLFLSPLENFREHLAFLAAVTGLFRHEGMVQELTRAGSPEEVLASIRRAEEENPARA